MTSDRDALALSALCVAAGTLHFLKPEPFDELIPSGLPGSARTWTLGSGVVELAVAGLLAAPSTRRAAGWAAAALFAGVLPRQCADGLELAPSRVALADRLPLGRLPIQLPLIRRALRVARS